MQSQVRNILLNENKGEFNIANEIKFRFSFCMDNFEYVDKKMNKRGVLKSDFVVEGKIFDEYLFDENMVFLNKEDILNNLKEKISFCIKRILASFLVVENHSYEDIPLLYEQFEERISSLNEIEKYGFKIISLHADKLNFNQINEGTIVNYKNRKKKKATWVIVASLIVGIIVIVVIYLGIKWYLDLLNGILQGAGI